MSDIHFPKTGDIQYPFIRARPPMAKYICIYVGILAPPERAEAIPSARPRRWRECSKPRQRTRAGSSDSSEAAGHVGWKRAVCL